VVVPRWQERVSVAARSPGWALLACTADRDFVLTPPTE